MDNEREKIDLGLPALDEVYFDIHDRLPEDSNINRPKLSGNLEEMTPNYEGNWAQLLHTRVLDKNTKEKFKNFKKRFWLDDEDESMGKSAVNMYDQVVSRVFQSTKFGKAKDFGKLPHQGGISDGFGDEGAIFSDAVYKGGNKSYSERVRTIVEAHEKAHGVFNIFNKPERDYVLSCFAIEKLNGKSIQKYDSELAYEFMARMSQLKNYFGFKGGEEFTKEHLDYARSHYVKDTEFDNNMSEFFDLITSEKENDFLKLMNEMAC